MVWFCQFVHTFPYFWRIIRKYVRLPPHVAPINFDALTPATTTTTTTTAIDACPSFFPAFFFVSCDFFQRFCPVISPRVFRPAFLLSYDVAARFRPARFLCLPRLSSRNFFDPTRFFFLSPAISDRKDSVGEKCRRAGAFVDLQRAGYLHRQRGIPPRQRVPIQVPPPPLPAPPSPNLFDAVVHICRKIRLKSDSNRGRM